MPHKANTDNLKCFANISLKRIVPPACSRLYGIEPIGIRTPLVESLTSYVIRVASAHCVRVNTLIGKEIAPIINKPYLTIASSRSTVATTFLYSARSINSFGVTATDWVNATQTLTLRRELCFLTMLPWKGLIAKSKLLRRSRAWCPSCYQEWYEDKKPIYDPLLWSLNPITVCLKHKRFLRQQCEHCDRQIPHLWRSLQSGFCPYCDQWLGISADNLSSIDEALTDDHLRWQAWVFDHMGSILASPSRLISSSENGFVIADLVSACIRVTTRGNLQAFVRRFSSLSQRTIDLWQRGGGLPELGRLMDLCYQTDMSMKDILLGNIIPADLMPRIVPIKQIKSRCLGAAELEVMETTLRLILNEDPPLSLSEMARCLGRYVPTIRRHFPELYNQIKERYSAYEAERFDKEKIGSSLLTVIDEFPPPSLQSVAKRLGCSRGTLRVHFPERTDIIVERYTKFLKTFADPEGIRAQLRTFQNEVPPLSITKCAERLGCTYGQLFEYFPDICRVIGARHAEYTRESTRQRREFRRQAIIKAKMELEAEGLPTTLYQIRKRLVHIQNLTNIEIDAAINGPREISRSTT